MGVRIFAVLCASITNAAFGWLALFVLNIGVLKINSGPAVAWPVALWVNLLLIASFGVLHSVMARPSFKRWWTQIIPPAAERSFYLLTAALTLFGVMAAWLPIPYQLWAVDGAAAVAIYAVFGIGLALVTWSILCMDPLGFYGLRGPFGLEPFEDFSTAGPYRFIRHPIQTGTLMVLWATPVMTAGQAVFAGAFTLYSIVAVYRLEEPDLRRAIGPAYARYAERVGGYFPRWRSG